MNERKRSRENVIKKELLVRIEIKEKRLNFQDIVQFISDFHSHYIHFKNIFCT